MNSKNFFIDLIFITFSKYLRQFTLIIKGLIVAKILSKYDYGVYNTAYLFITFSPILTLGMIYQLNKELSLRNKITINILKKVRLIKLLLLSAILILLGFLLFIKATSISLNSVYFFIPMVLFLHQINMLNEYIFRALQRFKIISVIILVTVLIDIIFISVLFLTNILNLTTIFIPLILSYFLGNYLYKVNLKKIINYKPLYGYKFIYIFKYSKKSIKLMVYNMNFLLFTNIDKIFILTFLSLIDFATYTFAANLAIGVLIIFQGLNYIVYPKMLNKFSKNSLGENSKSLYKYLVKILLTIFILGIIVVAMVFYISKIIINNFYPEFQNALLIVLILSISQLLNILSTYNNNVAIAKSTEKKIILNQFSVLVIMIIFNLIIVINQLNIYYISGVTLVSQLLLLCLAQIQSYKLLKNNDGVEKNG